MVYLSPLHDRLAQGITSLHSRRDQYYQRQALRQRERARKDRLQHLTEGSKSVEFRAAITQLKAIDAPVKLVSAGKRDFTLDDAASSKTRDEVERTIDERTLTRTYGALGEARALFKTEEAKAAGILFLDEGMHQISLRNGANMTVYASPYTPSKSSGWGFQYNPSDLEHDWTIDMTHSPPRDILDYTESKKRVGSPSLFAAITKAGPRAHCFGHIHGSWGAKFVEWGPEISEEPSHSSDIDNDKSILLESRTTLSEGKYDDEDLRKQKATKLAVLSDRGYREISESIVRNEQILFVNAATEGIAEGEQHLPWSIEMGLPQQDCAAHELDRKAELAEIDMLSASYMEKETIHPQRSSPKRSADDKDRPAKQRAVVARYRDLWFAEGTLSRRQLAKATEAF